MLTPLPPPPSDDDQRCRATSRVGKLVNERWHLDSLIGVGGMASVYAATHRNGKQVAIKMLHPELSTDAGVRQRFIDEGYVANRVNHPGTASVLDDGETDEGLVFLVMDLLQGQTLEERLQEHRTLHPREVLTIAGGVLDVLEAAHDAGIVHRDIKPANIFLVHDGAVKLLDFGIARLTSPGHPTTTQWGVTMGTPTFMAPEQARGHWEQVDGRTDLWALGASMFMALTGRPVHAAETTNEELLSAMTKRAPLLGNVVPGASKLLVELVDRALAFEPAERWPGARAMQTALRMVQAEIEAPHAPVAHSDELPAAASIVGQFEWLPNVKLSPRAMWIAKTRTWVDLPETVSNTFATLPRRVPHLRLFGILAGVAAFTLVLIGRTGHPPPTRADTPSMPAPITAQPARGVEPSTLEVAPLLDSDSELSTPAFAAASNDKPRPTPPSRAEPRDRRVQNPPDALEPPTSPKPASPAETDPLSRRK